MDSKEESARLATDEIFEALTGADDSADSCYQLSDSSPASICFLVEGGSKGVSLPYMNHEVTQTVFNADSWTALMTFSSHFAQLDCRDSASLPWRTFLQLFHHQRFELLIDVHPLSVTVIERETEEDN